MIPKDVWIKNVVGSLKEIASEEYQIKGWVNNEIHDYCTFTETCCRLFDDIQLDGFFEQAKEFGLTDVQIKKLDTAFKAFQTFSNEYSGFEDPQIIVNDPALPKVRKLAKEALESMGIAHYLDPSKQIVKDMLLYRLFSISNPSDQQKTWTLQEGSIPSPLEKLMDKSFLTTKVSQIITHYKEYEITDEQVEKLKMLFEQLKTYQEKVQGKKDYLEILDDPEWHQIQALAKNVVELIGYDP